MKGFFPRPRSGHFRGGQYPFPTLISCDLLPWEIFIKIAGFLQSDHLLNFSLASSQFRRLLLPELYRTVALHSSRACLSGLAMLRKRPELCMYIRSLIVRPNCAVICWPRTDGPVNETDVASIIEELADNLTNLEKFEWSGLELPSNQLCVALRRKCPMLTEIVSSGAGSGYLSTESEVFNFENLTAFSLFVPPGPKKEFLLIDIPHSLWDMLTHRAANLQKLSLQLFYSSHHLLDLDRLLNTIFPRLCALHLDIVCAKGNTAPSQPFTLLGPFLSAHPLLTSLSIHPCPDVLPLDLPPTALTQLTAFVGVYQHVAELPHPELLETLDLTGAPVSAPDMKAIAAALSRLVSLKSLDVRVAAPALLVPIIEVCGGLTTLRVVFAANFGMKYLRSLSASLHQHLPHLRSFTLYKGHRLTDGTMLQYALTILANNPALQEIHLAWFAMRERFARRQNGSYVMRTDVMGMRYLEVCERGVRSANMGGGIFGRRFRYALEGKMDFRGSVERRVARIRR
ncbi:hypothetical protein MSAN_00251900 [Mycena sanguinolenta]|uniref:F-box domain-containing protein n=1 Tax=Mycena sanguinolenta TaxID=230812 RepID=A0A8H7DL92_9AGAR|nr:hypothetical protein MSAN_00251900 [Mycena sanguinolenta]